VTFAVRLAPVAALAGVLPVTVGAGPVRNVHVVVANGFPAASRIAAAPPVNVTVYSVSLARLAVGLIVNTLVAAANVTAAATGAAVPARTVAVVLLNPVIASLNVAVTLLATATAFVPAPGVLAVMVGAGPVRNVQLTEVSGLFAISLIAAAPPVNRTVYLVSGARFALGLMVSTRVAVLNVTADGTIAPVATVPTRIVAVAGPNPVIASLKVAVAFTVTAWFVAVFSGVSADAVGGVVSATAPVVNDHVVLASGLFAPSRMPVVALPVRVTV
jgi:hypothetical protein